jgi:hypothetical protein
MIVSIDPDTKRQALAFWRDRTLSNIGWWVPGDAVWNGATHVVIEQPHATVGRGRGQDPDAIVRLAWAGGAALACWTQCFRVPHTVLDANKWSQVPKPIRHKRALDALTPAEIAIIASHAPLGWDLRQYVEAACERRAKNRGKVTGYSAAVVELLDTVSIGLCYLGRL